MSHVSPPPQLVQNLSHVHPDPQAFPALAAFDVADATTCISSSNPLNKNKEYFAASDRVEVDGTDAGSAEVTVAGDFSITYHKHFKVLKNLRVTPAKTYVLRMCGSDVPTKYPNGTAIESDAKHFSVPVKGVGVGGSIPMAFLEQLDLDKIKVADPQYVHSPCVRNAEKAGTILGQGSGSSPRRRVGRQDQEQRRRRPRGDGCVEHRRLQLATRTSSSIRPRTTPRRPRRVDQVHLHLLQRGEPRQRRLRAREGGLRRDQENRQGRCRCARGAPEAQEEVRLGKRSLDSAGTASGSSTPPRTSSRTAPTRAWRRSPTRTPMASSRTTSSPGLT